LASYAEANGWRALTGSGRIVWWGLSTSDGRYDLRIVVSNLLPEGIDDPDCDVNGIAKRTSELYDKAPEVANRHSGLLSASPQLSHVRASDVDIIVLSGIRVVIANRKGISVYDAAAIEAVPLTGWVWKIPRQTLLPQGLKLVQDYVGHYVLSPTQNMPLDRYKGILEELGLKAQKVFKKTTVRR